jgi:predicted phosphoadenosine phosphosulfate sulfurtransferase
MWEHRCYSSGIPDEIDAGLERSNRVPSYKAVCRAIMKNDTHLKTLGFTATKKEAYYLIKRKELMERGVRVQLTLF